MQLQMNVPTSNQASSESGTDFEGVVAQITDLVVVVILAIGVLVANVAEKVWERMNEMDTKLTRLTELLDRRPLQVGAEPEG